ncbi:MAG: diguanylate cyclase, partial [bacterium]
GMGEVFLAYYKETKNQFALKKVRNKIFHREKEIKRLEREFHITRNIRSRYVVEMYDFFKKTDDPFYTMEYVPGKPLSHFRGKPLEFLIDYFINLAHGILDFHNYNIVHRDLKPANIIVDDEKNLKILDFGLVTFHSEKITTKAGTFRYVAPEILMNNDVDWRSDLFSAGILMYETLLDSFPYAGPVTDIKTPEEELENVSFPETMNPDMVDLLKMLIHPDPSQRISDAMQMLHKLEEIKSIYVDSREAAEKGFSRKKIEIGKSDFISRHVEMDTILNKIDNFLSTGVDYAVVVEGVSGIGKTSFLQEVAHKMVFRDISTLSFSGSDTLDLFSKMIRTIWDLLDREYRFQIAVKWGGVLLMYFPSLGDYPEFANISPGEQSEYVKDDLYRLVSVFNDMVKMITGKKPLLLMIDDFGKADKRSQEIFQEFIMMRGSIRNVFTVVSVSTDVMDTHTELPANTRVELAPFNYNDTRNYLESSLNIPLMRMDEDFIKWVFKTGGGIVKLMRSILFMLKEEHYISMFGSKLIFRKSELKNRGLEYLLKKRLDSLGRYENIFLRAASIYKKFITFDALRFILSGKMNEKQFFRTYDILSANYMLKAQKNGIVRFIGGRIHNIVSGYLSDEERRYYHCKMSEFLLTDESQIKGTYVNVSAFAAYHSMQAGDFETALKLYLVSASDPYFHHRTGLTAFFLEEALSIIKKRPAIMSDKKKCAVYLFAGKIFFKLGYYEKSHVMLSRSFKRWKHHSILEIYVKSLVSVGETTKAYKALQKFSSGSDRDKKAFIQLMKAYVAMKAEDDYGRARKCLSSCITHVESGASGVIFDNSRLYMLKQLEFDYYMIEGEKSFDEMEKVKEDLIVHAEKMSSSIYMLDSYNAAYKLFWKYNKLNKAYELLLETLRLSLNFNDNYRISRTYQNLATCSHRLEKWDDVEYYLDRAMEYARKSGGNKMLKFAYFNRGEYAFITGDYSLAENFLFNAEKLSMKDERIHDLIFIYSTQMLMYLLKKENGFARHVGGKLRRLIERPEIFDRALKIRGLTSLLFFEAMTSRDKSGFFSLVSQLENLFEKEVEAKETYYLLFVLAKIIFAAEQGYDADMKKWIEESVSRNTTSTYSLFRIMYYYYTAYYLSRKGFMSELMENFLKEGRKQAVEYKASHFISMFSELSYFMNLDEGEKLFTELRRQFEAFEKGDQPDIVKTKDSFENLKMYLEETKKQIDYFRKKNRSYSSILDVVKNLSGKTELKKIMDVVIRKIINVLAADIVAIVYREDEDTGEEYLVMDESFSTYDLSEINFKGGIVPKMMQTKQLEFLTNMISDSPDDKSSDYSTSELGSMYCSVAALPIILQGEIKAYIYLERLVTKGTIGEEEINFLQDLGNNLGVILYNIKLLEIATTDALTKVSSRRHFLNLVEKEVRKAERYDFTLSMILMDLDNFKDINDTWGHLMGDTILRKFGTLLKENIRNTDYAGRIGGEEFAILLPGTNLQGAYHTAEKIRMKCSDINVSGVKVTLCAGVVSYHEDSVKNKDDLVEKADMAMYRGKDMGKNVSVRYSDL